MVYLENTTSGQTVWIPKNDMIGAIHTGTSGSYQEGFEDGQNYQQSLLASTAFTANGSYSRENGWNQVLVNVPASGSPSILEEKSVSITADTTVVLPSENCDGMSKVTIDASEYGQSQYDDGFDDGFTDGYSSGATDEASKLSAVTFTANTAVTVSDGGYSAVTVNLDTASTFNSGYTSGYTEGVEYGKDIQKRLMVSSAFTFNGQYQRGGGWSAITINVNQSGHTDQELLDMYDSGYTSGFTDGVISQKELLSSSSFTENGHYERENGWNEIDINIDTASTYQNGWDDGFESGVTHQQDLLSSTAFTLNGNYINPSGWSAISININQSGHTDQELLDMYDSGYTDGHSDGFAEGYGSGWTDGYSSGYSFGFASGRTYQRSLLSSTAFTENGTYENVNGWSSVTVNQNVMGELYAIYCENATLEFHRNYGVFDGLTASMLPLTDMEIAVSGSSYDRHFYWVGDSNSFKFYGKGTGTAEGGWATDKYTSTSSTITTKTFPNTHLINMADHVPTSSVLYVDNYNVSAKAIYRRITDTNIVKITGNSFYVRGLNINYDLCNYVPWVDSNGNACFYYNNTLVYPSSGNAYPVYRKLINGTYRYYIMNYVA